VSVTVDENSPRVVEATLVERARRGDCDAFGELVRGHTADALRLASFITRSRADAEDATQEAFIKAFHALDRFQGDRDLRPWLLRIVANEAKNLVRASGRRARRERLAGFDPTLTTVLTAPADGLAGSDQPELVAALAALNERDREVIGYRYFAGLDEAAMATAMRCAPGTVKSRLARALGRLRTTFEEVANG
jgi:RNA polymerase sigma-70 factor (ECF subfamily)